MSSITKHFQFDGVEDSIWGICFCIASFILVITIFAFIRIKQHLHYVPESSSFATDFRYKMERKRMKMHCDVSVNFALLCVALNFTAYPVCTEWHCSNTFLGYIYGVLIWDSYFLTKTFIYLLFFGRLFNPHYQRIHQYPRGLQSILLILLLLLVSTMIAFDITDGLVLANVDFSKWIGKIIIVMLAISDCTLAVAIMVLSFCPFSSSAFQHVDVPVMQIYGIVTILQFIATILFEMSLLGRVCMDFMDVSDAVWIGYSYIYRIVQMTDCFLLMLCVYFGFARQKTVCTLI